jgi:uncharacterized membrane protein
LTSNREPFGPPTQNGNKPFFGILYGKLRAFRRKRFVSPIPDIALTAGRSIARLPGGKAGGAPGKQLDSQIKEFANCRACAIAGAFAPAAWQPQSGQLSPHGRLNANNRGSAPVALFRGAETHSRSVLKAISWRTLGTLDTFAISWFFTGRVEIAGSIAGMEIITKIAWYYLHERVWAAIPWGRRRLD